tara:strand:+ start:702 stop:977 length:276 start_codon:yes stop_codon:yes gene_type:complete
MSDTSEDQTREPPVGEVNVIYLGPAAPHWEVRSGFGDPKLFESFQDRISARLMLLPPHDPQFRRNRERINRDAERENVVISWDLGYEEEEE